MFQLNSWDRNFQLSMESRKVMLNKEEGGLASFFNGEGVFLKK